MPLFLFPMAGGPSRSELYRPRTVVRQEKVWLLCAAAGPRCSDARRHSAACQSRAFPPPTILNGISSPMSFGFPVAILLCWSRSRALSGPSDFELPALRENA